MEIERDGNVLKIHGNLKSIEHYFSLKHTLEELIHEADEIIIHLIDSISITSEIIGHLSNVVHQYETKLHLHVADDALYGLLEDLNLITHLNIKKVSNEH